MSCKRKHKTLSLEDKTAILRRMEGERVTKLAKEFGIGKSTVSK
jgi:transposase